MSQLAITPQQAATEVLKRRMARDSLISYVNAIDVPGKPVSDDPDEWIFHPVESSVAAHHKLLLDAAQRTVTRPHGRCMFFLPPGSAKSTYGSIVVPTWCMGKWPGYRVILAAYGSTLARKHSRRARQIAKSPKYRSVFSAGISADSSAAEEWALDNGSEFMSGGILSGLTGNRANGIIIDDPVKGRDEAESDVIPQRTREAYDDDLKTRLLPGGWIMLIQTRWAHDDLAGSILPIDWKGESGLVMCRDGFEWEVVCIPAKADRADDPLGRNIGEYLWTEWFDAKHWAQFEKNERTWASLYQQKPSIDGGDILKVEHFQLWPRHKPIPALEFVLQSYDTAFTDDTVNDQTACTTWGIFQSGGRRCVLLLDAWSDHLGYPALRAKVVADWRATYGGDEKDRERKPRRVDVVLIEEKGSGISLIQDIRLANVPVATYNPGKASKRARAHIASNVLELDIVYVIESKRDPAMPVTWARPFLRQCEQFPNGELKDYVDCFSQAMIYLKDGNFLETPIATEDEPEEFDYDAERKAKRNPYAQ